MPIVRCLILWTFLPFLGGCHVADADRDETIAQQSSPRNVDRSGARDLGRANGLGEPTVNLTARERQVFKHAVRSEILAYVDGQQSSYADDPDMVDRPDAITSDMLQLKYERDTHRADGEFRGRHLIVTGRVASFKRVHGVLVGVRLSGGSTIFQRPTVTMVPESQAYVTTLTKGARVSFYCRGVGMHWGSARLGGCMPADAWIAAETERYEASFFGLHDDASSKKYWRFWQWRESRNCFLTTVLALQKQKQRGVPPS